jgi:integrase
VLLLCALRTGLRQAELLGLRWADVDFAGRFIAVNQSLVRGIIITPKNHQRRRVDMSGQLAEALAAERLANGSTR